MMITVLCSITDNYGVAKALGESDFIDISAPELLGSSGGALTCVGLVLGLNFDEVAELGLQCAGRCHGSVSGAFDLRSYLTEVLDHQFKSFGDRRQQPQKRSTNADDVDAPSKEGVGLEGARKKGATTAPPSNDAGDDSQYFSAEESRLSEDAATTAGWSCGGDNDGGENDAVGGNDKETDFHDDDAAAAEEEEEEEEVEEEAEQRRQCVAEALAGRVCVSVTTLPWLRNKRYTTFDDPEHVKRVLIASCW
jgi:hypothetical protein